MSTATVEEPRPLVAEPKEPLLSKENRRLVSDPFGDNNPITVQVLGICSALAVTTQVAPALVMAISVTFVVCASNVIVSMMRNSIPPRIRMIVQLLVIAGLVVFVNQVLQAFLFDVARALSVYIGLIITNCIVMGRLEAFAMANRPWKAFLDGLGNGAGYGLILIAVAFFRELFGSGTLLGFQIVPQFVYNLGYENNGIMLTPAAAMFLIGGFIWIQRALRPKLTNVS
jgi:Na+-transporting NADH:ubiquinone oxidoreductase subunit D